MNALPAYLQNRQSAVVKDRAVLGLGSQMPPHISIQGNQFTLIDSAGNEQTVGGTMDACVVDVSDVNCKKYFGKEWTPDSNDAPLCWSANGIGPSRDAQAPQARTCAECAHNVRGSAISKISGAAIKACRDEKWIALYLPSYPAMLFQLVLTPGSFQNWKAYITKFETDANLDISDVVTRVSFEPKVNGVLAFAAVAYIDEATFAAREKALIEKATTALVGRNDLPRQAALPAPQGETLAPASAMLGSPAPTQQVQQPSPFGQAAAPPVASPMLAMGASATSASPSDPTPSPRRRRNTAAQAPAAQGSSAAPAMAPFRPEASAPAQASNFGIQQPAGGVPNEVESTLNSIFGNG